MMDRKTFIKKTASILLLTAPAYALISCSSSSNDSNPNNPPPIGGNPNCLANGATASNITGNHGHSLTVSNADVSAGGEKTYNIMGTAGHSHNITVTAANFITLSNNQQITLNSTTGNGHTHTVTVSCA
jgi:hypothetical protein